eukprot:scaffold21269_cov119-Isochrysis_galbana.AAC.3
MGAALTYLLLELEGVDTEPDILDDGKKGPWIIFTNADCAEQFHAKHDPAKSGLKKEKGMGKEWERGGGEGVTGRQKDRLCSAVTPLVCSAFFL